MEHGDHTALVPIKRGDNLDAAELCLSLALKWDPTLLDWTAVKNHLLDVVVSGLQPLEETMQMLANWRDLSVDEAKAKLLAELFPPRETTKRTSGSTSSDTNKGEAGGADGSAKD
jgi:hypothetical protein